MDVLAAQKVVDAYGASIANVEWTNEPTPNHGYAIADFGGSLATRSGADNRFDFAIRCCGFTKDQALNTLRLVQAAFLDWRPWPDTRPDVKAELLDAGPLLPSSVIPNDVRWSSTLLIRIET